MNSLLFQLIEIAACAQWRPYWQARFRSMWYGVLVAESFVWCSHCGACYSCCCESCLAPQSRLQCVPLMLMGMARTMGLKIKVPQIILFAMTVTIVITIHWESGGQVGEIEGSVTVLQSPGMRLLARQEIVCWGNLVWWPQTSTSGPRGSQSGWAFLCPVCKRLGSSTLLSHRHAFVVVGFLLLW